MVSDSCHSGGLIDKTKEQIGNSTKQGKVRQRQRETRPPSSTGTNLCASLIGAVRGALEYIGIRRPRRGHQQQSGNEANKAQAATVASRSLPLSTYIRMLKQQTGKDDVGVGSIRATLFHHFGEDATPKIKKFVKAMAGGMLHRHSPAGATGTELTRSAKPEGGYQAEALGLGPAMQQEVQSVEEVYAGAAARVPLRNGVLISGCQTDQDSSDLTTADGASYGALSNAIQAVLAGKKHSKVVTNRELVVRARALLSKQGYLQKPGLYCSDEHADAAFIC